MLRWNSKKVLVIFSMLAFALAFLYFLRRLHVDFYFKGERDLKKLTRYLETQPQPSFQVPQFVYIAHAGGGYRGETYLNNLEAIENSTQKKVNYIEIDFHYSKDSVVVLAHYFVEKTADEFVKDTQRGTRLTLASFMEWFRDKDVKLITDIKTDNIKILRNISGQYKDLLRNIIPQAYTIPEIIEIKEMGFQHVIYTNYISRYPNNVIIRLAETKCLYAITLPYNINIKLLKHFRGLNKVETPIFTNTVNDPEVANDLFTSGCRGIYTDVLLSPSVQ